MLGVCLYCSKKFERPPSKIIRSKNLFCSRICFCNKHNKLIACNNCKKEIRVSLLRFRSKTICCSRECANKLRSKEYLAHKNPNWKGEKITTLNALHRYIEIRLPKPEKCQICKINLPHDLANISQKYERDLSDWEWLCRKCHMIKDGRLEKLIILRNKKEVEGK